MLTLSEKSVSKKESFKALFEQYSSKEINPSQALREYTNIPESLFYSYVSLENENIFQMAYLVQLVYEDTIQLLKSGSVYNLEFLSSYEDSVIDDCLELYFCYLVLNKLYPGDCSLKMFLEKTISKNKKNSLDGFFKSNCKYTLH